MKLKNRNPRDFIGRTIIFRHEAWLVDSVKDDGNIILKKPALDQQGLLRAELFDKCELYPQAEEIRTRFPMLLRALKSVCMLTDTEAVNAIFGMITYGPRFMGSEAVAHIGGSGRAIAHCWLHRHRVRESFARWAKAA